MVKFTQKPGLAGPSSSLGIMRFFDQETSGPKMTPEFVVIAAAVFAVAFIALHMFT